MDNQNAGEKGHMTFGELETPCPECKGSGWYNYGQCGLCHGTGYMTTESGEKVLSLVRHHFGHLLRNAAAD